MEYVKKINGKRYSLTFSSYDSVWYGERLTDFYVTKTGYATLGDLENAIRSGECTWEW